MRDSMRAVDDNTDLACELLSVASRHPARATHGIDSRKSQTVGQVALKVHL